MIKKVEIQEVVVKYRKIIELSNRVIEAIRIQNTSLKGTLLDNLLKRIEEIIIDIPVKNKPEFDNVISNMYDPIENQDDVLVADYLESIINPFFSRLLESIVTNLEPSLQRVELSDELYVELTATGNYTIKFRGIYFHSNNSPEEEALKLAEYWDEPMEKVCLVWGLGLGYHILKMLEIDHYRKIYVFEPENIVIETCKKYGVWNQIEKSGRAVIVPDYNGKECAKYAAKYVNSKLNIHYPTLKAMREGELKESFKKFYTTFSSQRNQKRSYYMSFRENTSLEINGLDELKFNSEAYRAIIVSAGPSLDKNYLELKKKGKNSVIIATAPTLSKLYKAGIIPDCVVISDTNETCKRFHNGAEDAKCSLVFSSTASVLFVSEHKGPKYILCPEGFEPAERLAKDKGWPIIKSYGSVALTSLALAIYKGFKEIIFVGQDLCYKGNAMHAEGTSTPFLENGKNLRVLKDIYGDRVTTSSDLAIFKSQIESTIREHKDIKFFNATEGGLHIEGAKDVMLTHLL